MTNQLANPVLKQNLKNSLKKPVSNKMALNTEGATFWYVCWEMMCDITFCMFTVIWGGVSANSAHTYEGLQASWALGLAFIGGESDSLKGPLSTSNSGNWAGSVKKARGRLGSHDAPGIHFPKLPPRGCCLLVLTFVSDSWNKRSSLWLSCWVYSERMADFWL